MSEVSTTTTDPPPLHVAVFPWLAFGHLIPFLELSKSIASRGHKISFLSTPRNLQRLPPIPPILLSNITLVPLHLPSIPNLPPDAQSTSDLPGSLVPLLKLAFDGLRSQTDEFLRDNSPDWIVSDFAQYWLPELLRIHNVPCVFFSVFPAPVIGFFGGDKIHRPEVVGEEDFMRTPTWVPFETSVAFKAHQARLVAASEKVRNEPGVTDWDRHVSVMDGCRAVAVRGCEEFDPEWQRVVRDVHRMDVVQVGLLPPVLPDTTPIAIHSSEAIKWLDKQLPSSVIYIAFGSEAELSIPLIHQLALGLELAGLPFLWAFREPHDLPPNQSLFPTGFLDRTKHIGLVLTEWVPQLHVLSHNSTGGFFTHTGWSSVVESLTFGVPMVSLPIASDLGLNSRACVDKKVVVELERDEEDGSFTKEAVARAVRTVMVEEGGEEVRAAARKMKEVFADRELHEGYLDRFVEFLQRNI